MKDKLNAAANGFGSQVPPSWHQVIIYFSQQSASSKQATDFFRHYQQRKWLNDQGKLLRNWKKLAWTWIWYKN